MRVNTPLRMECSRRGLFIGGERARPVRDDPNVRTVTDEIPMTEVQRLLSDGQREAAARALAAAKEVAAPVPAALAVLTNPAGLSDAQLEILASSGLVRRGTHTGSAFAKSKCSAWSPQERPTEQMRWIVLSERIVSHHVASIVGKLGVSTRSAATAWAVKEGSA